MNNKIAALTVAFNEPRLLPACVRQFKKPYIEEDIYHMVLVSNKPWHGSEPYDNKGYFYPRGANSIIVDNWRDQASQFNSGLVRLKVRGYDWAIICDADEYYTPEDINLILTEIEQYSNFDCLRAANMEVYWKTPMYRIENQQQDSPIIAIRTDKNFDSKRSASLSGYHSQAILNHFSYVRSDEEMLKKINSFEHSDEFDKMEWYNNVWLPWTPASQNLHPVIPTQFNRAIKIPAPKSILENYAKEKHIS